MSSQDKPAKRAYRKRAKRDPNPKRLVLTERDKEIIRWLNKVRMMNIDQIQAIFFATKDVPKSGWTTARHRMRKLWDHELVARLQKPISTFEGHSYVYSLDKLGAITVQDYLQDTHSKVLWEPHHNKIEGLHISHYEATNDLWVVLHKLHQRGRIQLHMWYTDMQYKSEPLSNHLPFNPLQDSKKQKYVEPDGFYKYSLPDMERPHAFFVEIDTGKEKLSEVENKFKVYHAYRLSEASAEFYGATKWRLLLITSSTARMKNLIKKATKVGCEHYCWFTTQDNIDIWNPERYFENIWTVVGREGSLYSLHN